jgi:hypothetical protein
MDAAGLAHAIPAMSLRIASGIAEPTTGASAAWVRQSQRFEPRVLREMVPSRGQRNPLV